MRTAPDKFLRELKKIDPYLRAQWHEGRQRWRIVRLNSAPRMNGPSRSCHFDIIPVAIHDKKPVYRLREVGRHIMWVERYPDGGYLDLCEPVLQALRAGDTWNRNIDPGKLADDRDLAKEVKAQQDREAEVDDVIKTCSNLANPTVDLGG